MLKRILIAFAVVVALLLGFIASRPSTFHVERSIVVSAPAAAAFEQVNDVHKFNEWNPWVKIDPNMKLTYNGPEHGPGAQYSWVGNSDVGEGKMVLTDSKANDTVDFTLEFYKPMQGTSQAHFTFVPEGDMTKITWAMDGTNNFIAKAMCLVMNMDTMIGGQFEKGLASLKTNLEKK